MKTKRISKRRRRRILVLGTISIIVFVCFLVNVFTYSYKIIKLTSEQNKLEARLDELKTLKELKENEIEKLNDPEYVAKYAREKYGYTRDGELVIIDTTDKAEELLRDMKKETLLYKYILVGSAVGIIIIFAIIKRS